MNDAISYKRDELVVLQNQYDKEYVKDIVGVDNVRLRKNKIPSKKDIEKIVSTEIKRIRIQHELATQIALKSDQISKMYLHKYFNLNQNFKLHKEQHLTSKIKSKEVKKGYGIVFVGSKFTEFTCRRDNSKAVEMTTLSAYATSFSEPRTSPTSNRWKRKAMKFNITIAPNWLSRFKMNQSVEETPEFSMNIHSVERSMGVNSSTDKNRHLYENDSFENGLTACDENEAIEMFVSYLEKLYYKLNCKKLILASFSSSICDIGNSESVPIMNVISKMMYGHYEKLEKYVIGYTDLLSTKARKDFTGIFNNKYGKNQYFHEIKPFANEIIKEIELALSLSWPEEKNGSQALGGIMTLLAYHSSKKVKKIISLSFKELRSISGSKDRNVGSIITKAQNCSINVELKTLNFPCFQMHQYNSISDLNIVKQGDTTTIDIRERSKRRNTDNPIQLRKVVKGNLGHKVKRRNFRIKKILK